jgi:hypothetical protein
MGGNYFPGLYSWLRSGGYAAVNGYLRGYRIPAALDPGEACQRAPRTSSTDEAVSLSYGSIEQEILEAIDEGLPGFAGGWVSSVKLTELLQRLNMERRIPPRKRKMMLSKLGFEYHPNLPDGRSTKICPPENAKPRLFLKKGHPSESFKTPAEILNAYMTAQKYQSPARQSTGPFTGPRKIA